MPDGHTTEKSTDETIILEETKYGAFQVKVRSGTSTFIVDEPFGDGGLASGPNPYDLLSAAVGACSLMTMRLFATQNRWPLEQIRVRVTHQRPDLKTEDVFVKEIELLGPLSELQRQRLSDVSDNCPVQLTISRGSTVRTLLLPNHVMANSVTSRNEHLRDMHAAIHQRPRA